MSTTSPLESLSTTPAIPIESPFPASATGIPRPAPSDLLAPTDTVEIQEITQELRASLGSVSSIAPAASTTRAGTMVEAPRSYLRDIDPSGLTARVDWPLAVRTLGSDRAFRLRVTELTPRSLFVSCPTFSTTAFRAGSTIVQAELSVPRVLVEGNGTPVDHVRFSFLAKVVKVIPVPGDERECEGFVIAMVQMEHDKAMALSDILARLRDAEPGWN